VSLTNEEKRCIKEMLKATSMEDRYLAYAILEQHPEFAYAMEKYIKKYPNKFPIPYNIRFRLRQIVKGKSFYDGKDL
jgi:hypothetical protein